MWQIYADTGGTFTDCLALGPDGAVKRFKVLSSSKLRAGATELSGRRWLLDHAIPCHPALLRGFRATLGDGTHRRLWVEAYEPSAGLIEFNADPRIESGRADLELSAPFPAPVLAALMATGAPDLASAPPYTLHLATTRATNALLQRKGGRTALLVTRGFEDLLRIGTQQRPDLFSLAINRPEPLYSAVFPVTGRILADGTVETPLDLAALERTAIRLREDGFEAVCISFMHAWKYPAHEEAAADVLRKAGLPVVVCGSGVSPFLHYLNRTRTALTEAFLTPVFRHFVEEIAAAVPGNRFFMVDSTGGLRPAAAIRAVDGLVSGPAAGVLACARLAARYGSPRTLTFDMGGTSTDVARIDGRPDLMYEHKVGDVQLALPSTALETVAAGGGSICRMENGRIRIGPESAGAEPGPACYGRGGPFTLTDANLLTGRLRPEAFQIPVHRAAAQAAFQAAFPGVSPAGQPDFLNGLIELADETMAEAIRSVSVRQGYEPDAYALTAFGGAGGIHACRVAQKLGIKTIYFPAEAGIFSASGIASASLQDSFEQQLLLPATAALAEIHRLIDVAKHRLAAGFQQPVFDVRFGVRLPGQQTALEVQTMDPAALQPLFEAAYQRQYGYAPPAREPEVVWMRVFVREKPPEPGPDLRVEPERTLAIAPPADGSLPWLFRSELKPGDEITGPLVVCDALATLVIEEGWVAAAGPDGTLVAEKRKSRAPVPAARHPEAVQLELYISRFRAIVAAMGEQLRRTSVSVNVKDRLDFSCALFDPQGRLVANAPHIPVHLGALGPCVRASVAQVKPGPGDVILTNHPAFGGSHLPDLTLIAPVHDATGRLIGYLANRAHHAELGGRTPGSMPADATLLEEEGVQFEPFLLVKNGVFQQDALRRRLTGAGFPSRNPAENEADLLAGLASIESGRRQLLGLASTAGADTLLERMEQLRTFSARQTALMLEKTFGTTERSAEEYMDHGPRLAVKLRFNAGTCTADFTGTSPRHAGNLNANPAILSSVLMYVLRLQLNADIPLNEGLLEPVTVILPHDSVLSPAPARMQDWPAVVGGNTETSQKVTALLLKALGTLAGGQATMNNLLFGDDTFGYYETLGGGAGAGPGFHGAHAVHTHMTNTALTDAEILETRYPVVLLEHAIRTGSGGGGQFRGGDGQRRVLRFTKDLTLSLLAGSRVVPPFGLAGGRDGATGTQFFARPGGGSTELPASFSRQVAAGTVFVIETPGGGGYGSPHFQ